MHLDFAFLCLLFYTCVFHICFLYEIPWQELDRNSLALTIWHYGVNTHSQKNHLIRVGKAHRVEQ